MAAQMWAVSENGKWFELFSTYAAWCEAEWQTLQRKKAELERLRKAEYAEVS